jgi:hypothetical protein
MTGLATYPTDVETSGGFRIETSPEKLTVTRAMSSKARLWIYLTYAFIFFYLLFSVGRSSAFLLLLLLAIGGLRYLFNGVHNLRCDRNNLEVIDIFPGRTKRTRSYNQSEVSGIRFGAVSFSRYGANGGLIFEVAGKKIKLLYGLKCIEAQKILDELQRLGFNVLHDPGMSMMIEMEQSRRKSWLGKLFA